MYVVLNTYSRKLFGKELEALSREELYRLVLAVMPGREDIILRVFTGHAREDVTNLASALREKSIVKQTALFL